MNRVYKPSLIVSFALTFGVIILSTPIVFARDSEQHNSVTTAKEEKTTDTKKTSIFCTNLPSTVDKINKNLADKISKMQSAQSKRDQNIADNQAKWYAEIKTARDKADAKRKENFAKLEANAKTDEQKTSVADYKQSILEAVASRRASFDASRATFRSGLVSDVAKHQTEVNTEIANMKTAVASAISTAQASCASDPSNGQAIREKFIADLKTARLNFKDGRKNDTKVSDDIKKIQEEKKSSFKDATTTFTQTTSKARETLKSSLGKKQ